MLSTALSTQGAIPKTSSTSLYGGSGATVSIGGQSQPSQASNGVINLGSGNSSQNPNPVIQKPGSIQGLINVPQTPAPSTAIKSTSVTHPSGTVIDTTYHAPDIKAPDDPSNKYNTSTGQLNSNYKDPNAPIVSQQTQNQQVNSTTGVNANNSTTTPQYTPPNQGTNGISQGGLIGNAVGQSQTPNPIATTAANNLNNIGNITSPAITQANQELENLKNEYMKKGLNIQNTAGFLTQANGEQGQLAQQYNNALAAAQGKLQNALSAQGQQISASSAAGGLGNNIQGLQQGALGTAIGANAPQYGVSYGTQVGQPSQSNGGINSSALGGVAAPANIKSIQDFTSQINTTEKSVNTLNNLANQIIPNMGTTGFNQNLTPIGNQTFAQYFANSDPASNAGIKAGLGEIKNQISNVISSATGLTPTAVSGVTDSYDFVDLNPKQLNDFLLYINEYAKSNIAGAQKSIQDIQNGNQPSATPGTLPISTAKTDSNTAALATGATLAEGLVSKVLSSVGNAVGNAAGLTAGSAITGVAAKVLAL